MAWLTKSGTSGAIALIRLTISSASETCIEEQERFLTVTLHLNGLVLARTTCRAGGLPRTSPVTIVIGGKPGNETSW